MMCLMLGETGGLPKEASFNIFGTSKDDRYAKGKNARCVKGLLNGISEVAPNAHL
jgi:hypothetical protein